MAIGGEEFGRGAPTEDLLHEHRDSGLVQWTEGDPGAGHALGRLGNEGEGRLRLGAAGQEQPDGRLFGNPPELPGELDGRGVRPMEILDGDDQGALPGQGADPRGEHLVEFPPAGLGGHIPVLLSWAGGYHAEQVSEVGKGVGQPDFGEGRGCPPLRLRRSVLRLDAQGPTEKVNEGPIRQAGAVGDAMPVEPPDGRVPAADLLYEPRLADAGVPGHEEERSPALRDPLHQMRDGRQLPLPADQRADTAPARGRRTSRRTPSAGLRSVRW